MKITLFVFIIAGSFLLASCAGKNNDLHLNVKNQSVTLCHNSLKSVIISYADNKTNIVIFKKDHVQFNLTIDDNQILAMQDIYHKNYRESIIYNGTWFQPKGRIISSNGKTISKARFIGGYFKPIN
jgi:hypothetical protein